LLSEKEMQKKKETTHPLQSFLRNYFNLTFIYLFVNQNGNDGFFHCAHQKKIIVPTSSKSEINFYAFDFRFVVPH